MKAKEWVCRVGSQDDVNRSSQRSHVCQPDPSATLMSMWARATGRKLYSCHGKLGDWDYEDLPSLATIIECLATMSHEASLTFLESFGNISEDYLKSCQAARPTGAQTYNTDTHSPETYNADTHSSGTSTAVSPGGIQHSHSHHQGPHAGRLLLLVKEQVLGPSRQQQAGLQVIKIIQHMSQCVY